MARVVKSKVDKRRTTDLKVGDQIEYAGASYIVVKNNEYSDLFRELILKRKYGGATEKILAGNTLKWKLN